jgi:hypothetical protein
LTATGATEGLLGALPIPAQSAADSRLHADTLTAGDTRAKPGLCRLWEVDE